MEGKRLDLDAPLISVRRIAASSPPSKDAKPKSRRVPLRSGHVENSGAVPFIWEKRPGRPKDSSGDVAGGSTAAPNLPPGRILMNTFKPKPDAVRAAMPISCLLDCGTEKLMTGRVGLNPADCGEECDTFSDVRGITFSCNESFSMRSGMTGLSLSPGFRDSTSQFSKDLQMEEYMMGRFLPAAQAMASGSPQQSWKKPPPRAPMVDKNLERKTVPRKLHPLHHQLQLSFAALHDNGRKEEEEEEEVASDEIVSNEITGYFSSMARGLISRFAMKNAFCFLNPVPGMKVRDLPPTKFGRLSKYEGIVQDSWEAVYMHRSRNVDYIQNDVDNKLTTDSQTLGSSSSFHHSPSDALSPNKNEDLNNNSKSSKNWSLDSDKEDIGTNSDMGSNIGRMQGSGSTAPAIDKTHINSSQLSDASNSNLSFVSITKGTKENADNGYILLSDLQRTDESIVSESSGGCQPQSKFSRVAEPDSSSCNKTLICENKKENCLTNSQSNDVGFDLKTNDHEKNIENSLALSLLPPPLPKPPSDSWLQRTLPNISAKGPYQQSFLETQFHQMNQTLQAIPEKSSKMNSYQTTFSGVPKPAC